MSSGYYGASIGTQVFLGILALALVTYIFINRSSTPVVNPTPQTGGKRLKGMDPSYGIVGFIFAFSLFAWDYLTNL